MTAEELNHKPVSIAYSKSMGETSWSGKAQYLGMRLQRCVSSYRRRFGLEIVRDSHTKINRYCFAPTEEQLALLRNQELRPATAEPEAGPEPEWDRQEKPF